MSLDRNLYINTFVLICGIDSLKGVSTDILTLCIQTAESFQTCRSKRRRRRRRSIGKWKRIVLFLPVNAYFSKLDPLTFRLDEISALNKTMLLGEYRGMHVSLEL